jgi:hypothetical protein
MKLTSQYFKCIRSYIPSGKACMDLPRVELCMLCLPTVLASVAVASCDQEGSTADALATKQWEYMAWLQQGLMQVIDEWLSSL